MRVEGTVSDTHRTTPVPHEPGKRRVDGVLQSGRS
jgi:hypothetical protein